MSADELVDVVDEGDRVIAQATRRDIRRRNLRHRGVYVFVFNATGQLLVHRRTATKDVFPDCWDIAVGGVVRAGEDYESAARRELSEELGVPAAVRLRRLFPVRYADADNQVVGLVFSCTCSGPFRLQPTEIVEAEWMDLDAILERTQRDRFCPDSLEALRVYLSKLEAVRTRS